MIRIIIVDDDIESAKALKRVIDGKEGVVVEGMFENGEEAVDNCLKTKPDLVLLDVQMPGMDGIEVCRRVKQGDPCIKILILTFYQIKENEIAAIQSGCDGYLYKGHSGDEMLAIIKSTMNGLTTYDNGVRKTIHDQMMDKKEMQAISDGLEKLSERQKAIISLITAGKRNSEIAKELFIDEGYLRNQLVHIRTALGLRNSKELAVWGARAGL